MKILELDDLAAWETWLEAHHDDRLEAWLRIGKRRSDVHLIAIGDALDGALGCRCAVIYVQPGRLRRHRRTRGLEPAKPEF